MKPQVALTSVDHPSPTMVDKNMNGVVRGERNIAGEAAETRKVVVGSVALGNLVASTGTRSKEHPLTPKQTCHGCQR